MPGEPLELLAGDQPALPQHEVQRELDAPELLGGGPPLAQPGAVLEAQQLQGRAGTGRVQVRHDARAVER
eukprot:10376804-Lingulodinium_polyedra.AAC.1